MLSTVLLLKMIHLPVTEDQKSLYALIKKTYKRRLVDLTVNAQAVPDVCDLIRIFFLLIAQRM